MHFKQIMGHWERCSIANKAAGTGEQNKDPYRCHMLISRQKKFLILNSVSTKRRKGSEENVKCWQFAPKISQI